MDLWFSSCPACLEEMARFPALLEKAGGKVRIVSISINTLPLWREALSGRNERLRMLSYRGPDWVHLAFASKEPASLHNEFPADVYAYVTDKFQTTEYPFYLVLDGTGKVIAAPSSAVAYIEDEVL